MEVALSLVGFGLFLLLTGAGYALIIRAINSRYPSPYRIEPPHWASTKIVLRVPPGTDKKSAAAITAEIAKAMKEIEEDDT